MPFEIIHDQERGLAVLIAGDAISALGPVAAGPDPVGLLGAFVGFLDADPETLPQWRLMGEWSAFVTTAVEGGLLETPTEPETGGVTQEVAPEPAAPETAAGEAVEPETPAQPETPTPAREPAPAEPADGKQVCPVCNGTKVEMLGGVEQVCGMCDGTGRWSPST